MNEEQIREIAKETFAENIMNNLDSSIVFKYIQELEQENQKYKEVINKAINKLEKGISFCKHDSQGVYDKCNMAILREQEILDILKEVEHE